MASHRIRIHGVVRAKIISTRANEKGFKNIAARNEHHLVFCSSCGGANGDSSLCDTAKSPWAHPIFRERAHPPIHWEHGASRSL